MVASDICTVVNAGICHTRVKIIGNPKSEPMSNGDTRNRKTLEENGWRVIVIWECELKKRIADERLARLCEEIKTDTYE